MSILIGDVRANISTSGTTTDFTIGSFGTVVAARIKLSGATTDDAQLAHAILCEALWDGTNVRSVSIYCEDNLTVRTDSYQWNSSVYAAVVMDGTGAVVRKFTVSAITNGIRLTADSTPGTAWKCDVRLFGGTQAQGLCKSYTGAPITGNGQRAITGAGFRPNAAYWLGNGTFSSSTSPAGTAIDLFSLGFGAYHPGQSPNLTQGHVAWRSKDNVLTSETQLRIETGSVSRNAPAVTDGNVLISFDADGATIQNDTLANQGPDGAVLFLNLPGLNLWVGELSTPTSNTTVTHAAGSPGFKLQAADILLTAADALGDKVDAQSAGIAHGSVAGATPTRDSTAVRHNDAVSLGGGSPSDSSSLVSAVLVSLLDGGGTVVLKGDYSSFPATGIAVAWSTTQGTARKGVMFGIGAELTLTPDPAVLASSVGAPTLTRDLRPTAAAVVSSVGSPTLTLVLIPTAAVLVSSVGAPTLARDLRPTAAVLVSSAPTPQLVLELVPTAAVLVSSAGDVTITHVRELAPDPAVLVSSVGSPQLVLELIPTAAVLVSSVGAPTLASELAPTPAVLVSSVGAPTLVLELIPTPAVLVSSVGSPQLVLELTPTAAVLVSSAPNVSVNGELTIAPDPAVLVSSVGSPHLVLELTPTAAVLVSTAGAVTITHVRELAPDPAVLVSSVGGPQLVLELTPTSAILVSSAPPMTLTRELTPTPAVLVSTAPPVSLLPEVTLTPSPAVLVSSVGGPQLVLSLIPTPAVLVSSVGSPQLVLELAPTPAVLVSSAHDVSISETIVLAPDPAVLVSTANDPQLEIYLVPTPAVLVGVVPIVQQGKVFLPDVVELFAVVPDPQVTIELTPDACALVSSVPDAMIARQPAVLVVELEIATIARQRGSISRSITIVPEDDFEGISTGLSVPLRL